MNGRLRLEWVAEINGIRSRTLKDLILKTELFDIKEELTKKGGVRVLFRMMDGVSFDPNSDNNKEIVN